MPESTIESSPNPQVVTIVMALFRVGLLIAGAAGLTVAQYTDAQVAAISGAVAVIVGLAWQVYEQFRQAKIRHAAAVASARGAKAVQHRDYSGGKL